MPSVVQDWMSDIPIRMQSTLMLGLRGPDTHTCPEIKKIQRWLRGLVFVPGNPANVKEFMGGAPGKIVEKSAVAKELEFCSEHFYSHLMHSLEVIGYRYPNSEFIRNVGFNLYLDMCNLLHLPIESLDHFEKRLGTIVWPGGLQPRNYEEAIILLEFEKRKESHDNSKHVLSTEKSTS